MNYTFQNCALTWKKGEDKKKAKSSTFSIELISIKVYR